MRGNLRHGGPERKGNGVKTATMEEIYADPTCLDRWGANGEEVRVLRDGQLFLRVVPELPAPPATPEAEAPKKFEMPDWDARHRRLQELNGGRPVSIDISRLRDEDMVTHWDDPK